MMQGMMMGLMMELMQSMMQGLMGQLMTGGHQGMFGAGHNPGFGGGGFASRRPGRRRRGIGKFLGGRRRSPARRTRRSGGSGPVSGGPVAPGVNAMLGKARSMLGLHEARDTNAINAITKKSGINAATTPWCAAFAMNLLKDHGVLNLDGLSNRNYVPTIESWAKGKGIYGQPGKYQPKPGDAIVFDWKRDGTSDHIGIVEKVENGKVYTIEGNSSNSVKRNSYPLNSSSIDGYVVTGKKKR